MCKGYNGEQNRRGAAFQGTWEPGSRHTHMHIEIHEYEKVLGATEIPKEEPDLV